jgi:hypothetical protein
MAIDPSVAPTLEDLDAAQAALERNEARALFYKAAAEIVDLALRRQTSMTVAEGIAILLHTWNPSRYSMRPFDSRFFFGIERVVATYQEMIAGFRFRTLDGFCADDEPAVRELYSAFEQLVGPDAAARCLNLLAPLFFPLWDHVIAKEYGLPLEMAATNAPLYLRFMEITRQQWLRLGGREALGRNPIRAIDEYNYCRCCRHLL